MSRSSTHTQGTVIARSQRGESSLRLHFLSPEHGRLILIKRLSQKRASSAPDLFDDAEIVAESSDAAGTFFLREYNLIERRERIPKTYANFECACRFASIIDKNLAHAEYADVLHHLCQNAFDAWNTYPLAKTILLKALYRMAKEEGYPAKEDWFSRLPLNFRPLTIEVLNTPLDHLSTDDPSLDKVLDHLLQWLEHHTDILT